MSIMDQRIIAFIDGRRIETIQNVLSTPTQEFVHFPFPSTLFPPQMCLVGIPGNKLLSFLPREKIVELVKSKKRD